MHIKLTRVALLITIRLEARTERVTIDGGDDVIVSSKAGSVKANAYHEFRMMGNERIVLDARRLEMRGLKRATVSPGEDSTATSAFQVSGFPFPFLILGNLLK